MAEDLGNAEVDYLQVPVLIEQQVFQLEVAVHNVVLVEVLQPKDKLHTVEFYFSFTEPIGLTKDLRELATSDEGHHEVKS